MAKYEKLVRDKIPLLLDTKGVSYQKRIASDDEYERELVKKLLEEAGEFAEAGAPEELADVLEVLQALVALPSYANVEEIREKKHTERGGFKDRIILSGDDGK